METLESLVTSGRIIELMLALVVIEALVLATYRLRTGGGIALRPLLANLGAGACLMLALRLLAGHAGWHWVAACLTAALCFHLADLAQRWTPARAAADRDPKR